MHNYHLKTKLHGEQSLATETLKLIPIVESHLKAISGMKLHIQSGDSAKYSKAKKAFYADCARVSKARIFLDCSVYSVWLKIDIHERSPDAKDVDFSVEYYRRDMFVGEIDRESGRFRYKFNLAETIVDCENVLKATESGLFIVRGQIESLKNQIDSLRDSVSYALRDTIS